MEGKSSRHPIPGIRRGRRRSAVLSAVIAVLGLTLTASAAFGGFDKLAQSVRDHVYCHVAGDCDGGEDHHCPNTHIVGGPHRTSDQSPSFRVRSTEKGSRFEYRVDRRGNFRRTGPKVNLHKVRPGHHLLQVRAVDKAGNHDRSEATRKFQVVAKRRHGHRHHHNH